MIKRVCVGARECGGFQQQRKEKKGCLETEVVKVVNVVVSGDETGDWRKSEENDFLWRQDEASRRR